MFVGVTKTEPPIHLKVVAAEATWYPVEFDDSLGRRVGYVHSAKGALQNSSLKNTGVLDREYVEPSGMSGVSGHCHLPVKVQAWYVERWSDGGNVPPPDSISRQALTWTTPVRYQCPSGGQL
jgi:hypothetical protein